MKEFENFEEAEESTEERGYGDFAAVYDLLTENVPYDEIAAYYGKILRSITDGRRLLDMGCGTGNLTVRLAETGFDVIGQDASEEMLSVAAGKSDRVIWICQDMAETDIGEEIDCVISTLDSLNHLVGAEELQQCFYAAAKSLKAGGAFVFDMNTIYKHREILGENSFVYDVDGAYCVWSNTFCPEDNGVDIDLDLFFEESDGRYSRGGESFREVAYSPEEVCEMLENAGFEVLKIYDYLSFEQPSEKSEKLLFAAKRL